MIYFVTALHCEAKPLITHYDLKKDTSFPKFEIYKNEETRLIISGTGMFKSAVAAAHLFSTAAPVPGSIAVNLGICGSLNQDHDVGKMFIINRIINNSTNKPYYPDMLLRHSLPESSLETFLSPVVKDGTSALSADLVDMEAVGFMEAASSFFPSHSIYCLKIVSDHLEGVRLSTTFVSKLLARNLPAIDALVDNAAHMAEVDNIALSKSDMELIDMISCSLKLSETMKHQLYKLAVHYKLKYKKELGCLAVYTKITINNKEERKKQFDEIKKLLAPG